MFRDILSVAASIALVIILVAVFRILGTDAPLTLENIRIEGLVAARQFVGFTNGIIRNPAILGTYISNLFQTLLDIVLNIADTVKRTVLNTLPR